MVDNRPRRADFITLIFSVFSYCVYTLFVGGLDCCYYCWYGNVGQAGSERMAGGSCFVLLILLFGKNDLNRFR